MTVKNNLIWVGASLAVFLFLISFGNKTLLYMNTADLIGSLGSQCAPNWQCNSWTECNSRGEAYRQCADINNCMRAVSPDTSRDCVLTPEMLTSYQNDYENKLLNIGGDTSKIKVDFTGGIGEQNSGDCQYINDTSPICYYFNLPGNMSIKFSNSQASGDSSQGEMTFINGDTNKKLMTGIGSLKDPLNKISAGFYVYPTNSENIFYIVGDKTIENNIMSWKEIYFDVSKQDIVFYADAGVNLGGTNVSFVNIKKGAQKEYDINVNLPSSCTFPEKYGLNGIFVNNVNNSVFPNSLSFDCNQDGQSYSDSIEVEPLALSSDFKTLHLFVHKFKNDGLKNNGPEKDGTDWHYLFGLTGGTITFAPNN